MIGNKPQQSFKSWSAVSVSTENVLSHLHKLIEILRITRSPSNVHRLGNPNEIESMFNVANNTATAVNAADAIQKQALLSSLGNSCHTNVLVLDENPALLIESPIRCLAMAIIGSPILTWLPLNDQASIVKRTLQIAETALGKSVTKETLTNILNDCIRAKQQMVIGTDINTGNSDYKQLGSSRTLDEMTLAVELLCFMHVKQRLEEKNSLSSPRSEYIEKYMQLSLIDDTCFRLLCVAASLRPDEIACICLKNHIAWQDIYEESCEEWIWLCLGQCLGVSLTATAQQGASFPTSTSATPVRSGLQRYLALDPTGDMMQAICCKFKLNSGLYRPNEGIERSGHRTMTDTDYIHLFETSLLSANEIHWPACKRHMCVFLQAVHHNDALEKLLHTLQVSNI